jgi:hypothetical protein
MPFFFINNTLFYWRFHKMETKTETKNQSETLFTLNFQEDAGREGRIVLDLSPTMAFSLMGLIYRNSVARPGMPKHVERAVNRLRGVAHQINNVRKEHFDYDDESTGE